MAETPWYDQAFRAHYALVYPHRDDDSARREARFVLELMHRAGLPAPRRIYDLGCGNGRHLQALAAPARTLVGLDRSGDLLAAAAARRVAPVVRGDLRHLPFAAQSADLATSFFTSFGLLESREDDRRVLAEVARVLRPGGAFFLDYLDAAHTERSLVPRSQREIPGGQLIEERRIEGGCVRKRVRIERAGAETIGYEEAVRLYAQEEVLEELERHGLRPEVRAGSYEDAPWGQGPRSLVLCRRDPES